MFSIHFYIFVRYCKYCVECPIYIKYDFRNATKLGNLKIFNNAEHYKTFVTIKNLLKVAAVNFLRLPLFRNLFVIKIPRRSKKWSGMKENSRILKTKSPWMGKRLVPSLQGWGTHYEFPLEGMLYYSARYFYFLVFSSLNVFPDYAPSTSGRGSQLATTRGIFPGSRSSER